MEGCIPNSSSVSWEGEIKLEIWTPDLDCSVMGTGRNKVFIQTSSDSIDRLGMGSYCAYGCLYFNFMLLLLNNRPQLQGLILTGRNNQLAINQYGKTTYVLWVSMIISYQSTSPQRINLMKFNYLIFSCSKQERMKIFSA